MTIKFVEVFLRVLGIVLVEKIPDLRDSCSCKDFRSHLLKFFWHTVFCEFFLESIIRYVWYSAFLFVTSFTTLVSCIIIFMLLHSLIDFFFVGTLAATSVRPFLVEFIEKGNPHSQICIRKQLYSLSFSRAGKQHLWVRFYGTLSE